MKVPPVEYAIFCDYASVAVDGKLNLNGIFERVLTQKVPAMHPQMFVVSKLLLPKGKSNITLTLMQEDKVLSKTTMEKEVEKPSAHTHFWGIKNLNIESWKPVELQILIGGKQVYVKRLPVMKVTKKEK